MPEKKRPSAAVEEFPQYCDYSCRYSAFSDPCAVGACRRDVGVWCSKAQRLHSKHARCLFRPQFVDENGLS
jgi:hypothetical protein